MNIMDEQGLWIVKVSCERLLLVNQTPLKRVTSHDRADFNKKFERGFMKKFKSWAEPFSTTFMFVGGDIKITVFERTRIHPFFYNYRVTKQSTSK